MRKTLLLSLVLCLSLATSCLTNEEPQSLIDLRAAKIALIEADVAYRQAETALLQADAELQLQFVEYQKLMNALHKIENDIREVELEIERTLLEREKAETEEMKKYYQKLISDYELEILQNQNLQALAIEQHKANMLNAQRQVALAEAAYRQALELIAAEKIGLTAAEQALVDGIIADLNVARNNLRLREDALIRATQNHTDLVYNFDEQLLKDNANRNIKVNQLAVDNALKAKEEWIAFMALDGDVNTWNAQVLKIENDIKVQNGKIDSIELLIVDKEAEISDLQSEYSEIYDSYALLNNMIANPVPAGYSGPSYIRDKDDLRNIMLGTLFEETITADAEIQDPLITNALTTALMGDETIIDPFDIDDQTGLWHFHNGKFTIKGNITVIRNYFEDVRVNMLTNLIFTDESLAQFMAEKATRKANFEKSGGIKERFKKDSTDWKKAVVDLKAEAAVYGLELDEDLQFKAVAARNAYISENTAANKTAMLDAVKAFRTSRDKLENDPYLIGVSPIQNLLTVAYFDADEATVQAHINNSINYYYYPKLRYNTAGNPESLLYNWHDLSMRLWGLGDFMEEVTTEDFGNWNLWYDDFSGEARIANIGDIVIKARNIKGDGNGYTVSEYTDILGHDYISIAQFTTPGSLWWDYLSEKYVIEYMEKIVAGRDKLNTVYDAVKAIVDEYDGKIAEYDASIAAIDAQIEATISEINAKILELRELQSQGRNISGEITAFEDEQNVIDFYVISLNYQKNLVLGLIQGSNPALGGVLSAEEVTTILNDELTNLDNILQAAQANLRAAQVELAKIISGETNQQRAIEAAQLAITRAQEDFDLAESEFNRLTTLLKETIDAIKAARTAAGA